MEEKEAKSMRLAEEEAKVRAHAKILSLEQNEDAYTVISNVDNTFKEFQVAVGLSDVSNIIKLVLKLCNILKKHGHEFTLHTSKCNKEPLSVYAITVTETSKISHSN